MVPNCLPGALLGVLHGFTHATAESLMEPKSPRSWKRESDQNRLLKGDLDFTTVAKEGIMQREGGGLTT